jgi:type IV pilus assembly protein PilX
MFKITRPQHPTAFGNQRGAALFLGLIMLVLLSLLAVMAFSTATMQERMTGGLRNRQLATMGAESALREGETRLWTAANTAGTYVVCGAAALFNCYGYNPKALNPTVQTFRTSKTWVTAGAAAFTHATLNSPGSADQTSALAANPLFMIEDLGIERPPGAPAAHEYGQPPNETPDKRLYRMTARSQGGNNSVLRVLESTFASKTN